MAKAGGVPSGTVTLLFTDIQGSTRRWEAEPEAMAVALRRHDEILRSEIETAGGYVFKTVGDAFCAAFATAHAAVAAALTAQRRLGSEAWPTSQPISVRMGLHTGVCEERDADYFGPVVNRAARLEAVAHGGQVLLSGATAELLGDQVPVLDLGEHRLKDLGRPEHIFQLQADFLTATFPPLASLDNPELPNNLPVLASAFIGREAELAQVRTLIGASRVVTLTGAGGSGKTRLALQAAAEQVGRVADGVWLAELAPLTDGAQIPATVAAALGMQELSGAGPDEMLIQALAAQDVLLLLDNCEHLIDAAAKFCGHVIRRCPKVRFLATSREPLGIDGEHIYRVPSLSLPEAGAGSAADLAGSDAVGLFAERAAVHDAAFSLDEESAPLIATICRRLDGIPLALELAAARLSSMSLRQVADRLDQRFRLLTGGARNALPRQQTLQATVEWSFGLLSRPEKDTLTRLSVFAGGFDLDAAGGVCASETVDEFDVADLLGSLVDKSLVVADRSAGAMRYRLLETIRQYCAQELLRSEGDKAVLDLRSRHAEYYLAVAEAAGPELMRSSQAQWLRQLDADWDNLRAAAGHFSAEDRPDDVLRLAVPIKRFLLTRGHAEVLDYLCPVLDREDAEPSALLAGGLLTAAALLGVIQRTDPAQMAAVRRYAEQALVAARASGDQRAEAAALSHLGESRAIAGDQQGALALAEQAAAIARQTGDLQFLAEQLQFLGWATNDPADRSRIYLEAMDYARRAGDQLLEASVLQHLFSLALHAGRIDEGISYLTRATETAEKVGGELLIYLQRCNLAILHLIEGRAADAVPLVRACLLARRRLGPGVPGGELVFAAACCASWQGDAARAACLHGAGDADIAASLANGSINWSAAEQTVRERDQAKLRELLGDSEYEAAYAAGARLTAAEAADLALGRRWPT